MVRRRHVHLGRQTCSDWLFVWRILQVDLLVSTLSSHYVTYWGKGTVIFFTARPVARCLFVCPSLCPSHAGIESKRLRISSKFFLPWGSPTILVFLYQTGWQYSDGDPPNWGVEYKGVMKKSRFLTNISLHLANDAR